MRKPFPIDRLLERAFQRTHGSGICQKLDRLDKSPVLIDAEEYGSGHAVSSSRIKLKRRFFALLTGMYPANSISSRCVAIFMAIVATLLVDNQQGPKRRVRSDPDRMFLMLARVNPGGAGTASRSRAWYIPHHPDKVPYRHLTTGAHPVPAHSAMEADHGIAKHRNGLSRCHRQGEGSEGQ